MYPVIRDEDTLRQEIDQLTVLVPRFADAYAMTGLPALRLRNGGFTQLYKAIVSQQLSVAAADSIWQKLTTAGLDDAGSVSNADENILRSNGLSKQKIRYVRSLAQYQIDYDQLTNLNDLQVIETLCQVTGIGRWTAEIYLLFSLNRTDVLAANDLALQVGAQTLFDLPNRPTEKMLRELSNAWAPHRSAASYLLWAYYGHLKNRAATNA